MAEEYIAPLGPYKEYAPDGDVGFLPPTPDEDKIYTDPRTGVFYGAYDEEEIQQDQSEILGVSIETGFDPLDVAKNRTALDLTMDPEQRQGTTDIVEIVKDRYTASDLEIRARYLQNQAYLTGDDNFLIEAAALSEEAAKLRESGILDNRGIVAETTTLMAEQAALMKDLAGEVGPKLAVPIAADVAISALTKKPQMPVTKFATGGLALEVFHRQMRGEIYGMLRSDETIDTETAKEIAQIMGPISAASEFVGIRAQMKTLGIRSDIADRIVGVAQEGGTEVFQSLIEDISLWWAHKKMAEKNGEAFNKDLLGYLDLDKAQQGARAGILTAGGMTSPGAAVKYSAKAVRAVQDADKKYIIRKKATDLIKSYNEKQAELVASEDKMTVPSTDPVTGQTVESAPLDPLEAERADKADGVHGTTITDSEIDDFMMLDDPVEIDAAADALVGSASNVEGLFTADTFFNNLRAILPKQEADMVESIMNARAASAGVETSKYIEDRQIALKEAGYKEGVNAEVTFTQEGRTIIRAFTGANVSSVLHEVGHVFRRDLTGTDLAVVERWAGVEPGAQWDIAAEEKFARAWERYLAEGKAPSQELIPAFNAFTKWITNIYKSIVGSEIDIELDEGVKQVFDNLLVAQEGAKPTLEQAKQQAITLQQTRDEQQERSIAESADRISTAYPTAGRRRVDPTVELVEVGQDLAKEEPAIYAKNAAVINGNTWTDKKGNVFNTYPGFKTRKKDPDKITEEYIDFAVDNLLWIYDQIPVPIRERSKLWYDGARHITNMWAERYDMQPHQVAGILASLSPQKDWYQNVSLAERVIDVVRSVDGTQTSIGTESKKFAIDLYKDSKGKIRKENRKLINEMIGVPYDELPSYLHRAAFVRVYDAMHNPKGYRIVTPEGAFIGETQGNIGWGSNVEIEKAVKAFDAQSRDEINVIMGDSAHKIRNFYNNIIAPNNGVDVTIDTHAKAAALLRPLSAKSFEVGHTFGGRGSGSSISGAYGLYGVDAEAYRRAANQRGVLPREMQSITWEAIRGLFEDTYKRTEVNAAKDTKTGFTTADAIWKQYELGKITKEQARQEVLDHAGGFTKPTWYGLDSAVSGDFRGTSYEGGVSGYGVSERTTGPLDSGTGSQPTGGPTRLEQSRSGARESELQAKYQRELLDRTKTRDDVVAAAEGKLSPNKTLAEQIKVHRRVMRQLFAAGETEGAKNERNKIKALLVRQRNRANVQKRHTAVRKQIIKLLADNMPKKISRKLQSGMDYDTQKVVTELYEALMDVDQDQQGIPFLPVKGGLNTIKGVKQMYYKYIEGAFVERDLTPVEILRNQIIVAAIKRNKFGLAELQELYGGLGQLVRMGKKASPAVVNLFKARGVVSAATPQIVGDVESFNEVGSMDIGEAHRQRREQKSWRQKIATMSFGKDNLLAWNDLMELISAYGNEKPGDSVLLKQLDFFDSSQKKKTDIRTSMDQMVEGYREAYGIKTSLTMNNQQNRDLKRDINIGWNRLVNKAQLRQIWMYMQDPTLNERLVYNGLEAAQRQAVEREMTEQDRQFASGLLEMFQDEANYEATNEVYKRHFGVDLERFDNYVPLKAVPVISTQQALEADTNLMGQFQQDKFLRRTPTSAGSLKGRALELQKSQLLFDGDLPLFEGWLEETAHFRAYSDVIRLANSVVNDAKFRDAVIYEYGPKVYNSIVDSLKANAADAKGNRETIDAVDRVRTAYVTGTIGLSTTVTMKQYISLLNFWQDMPFTDYVAGVSSLPANFELIKDIWKSDYLLNRRGNIDRDLKQAMRSKEYKNFMLNPSIKNFLTFNVTLGDSGAIALGGAVYVRYLMKQGYTKAQAIHEMGRKADRTQQSAATEQMSKLQRSGSIAKIMTTYSTGPVQATRQILAANRNLAAGRISVPQYAKEMFIYQAAVPIMYSLAAGLVVGDDAEEQLKNTMIATILGPWGSTYAAGRALTMGARKLAGMSYFDNAGPFTDTVSQVTGYTNKIAEEGWNSLTLDQYAKGVQSALVLFGYGIPLTKVTRTLQNAAEGDVLGAALATNPNR